MLVKCKTRLAEYHCYMYVSVHFFVHVCVCRARRALEHRKNMDEDRLAVLEDLVKEANSAVAECERRYDDVSFQNS